MEGRRESGLQFGSSAFRRLALQGSFFFVLMECFCAASLWSGPRSQQHDSNGAETRS